MDNFKEALALTKKVFKSKTTRSKNRKKRVKVHLTDQELLSYYTRTNNNVTKLINDNKTIVFTDESIAIEKAAELKTYVYKVYHKNKLNDYIFAGYAVPK